MTVRRLKSWQRSSRRSGSRRGASRAPSCSRTWADARIEGSDWEVRAAPAIHVQPFLDSLAYRIETGGGSIVITGDTEPCDAVVELAQGATVLVSMCWDHQHVMDESGEAHGQTGTTGAARIARDAGVEKLVLVHRGPGLEGAESEQQALANVSAIFAGSY